MDRMNSGTVSIKRGDENLLDFWINSLCVQSEIVLENFIQVLLSEKGGAIRAAE